MSTHRIRIWAWRAVLTIVILGVWQGLSGPVFDAFWLSRPSLIIAYMWEIVTSGQLLSDMSLTFRATAEGYVYGSVAGLLLGFVLAQSEAVAAVLNPFILAVYGIPRIALAPIFLLWFGIGITSKVMMAALMALMLVFFNTYEGVRARDLELENVARVMGANRAQLFWHVTLPNASPWIIAGLRIAIPQSLVAAVVAEFIASTGGLGYRIMETTNSLNTAGTMASILILMAVVILLNLLLDRFEQYILRWRPDNSGSEKG